ncbi:class I SAM-dependent methyltransferase [soil metagenome]
MQAKEDLSWFESWFDSPFYHILYQNRNEAEAHDFINNLLNRLHLPNSSTVLDLGCGKGRHSRYLNELGYKVTGVDLSKKNIEFCKQFENETLEFYEHDMRKILRVNYYDAVMNLFTSFGYFRQEHQNELVVKAAASGLSKGGYLVIDYFNSIKVEKNLVAEHQLSIDGINFHIQKRIENKFIIKDINFTHEQKNYSFREEVKILSLEDFSKFFLHAGLSILNLYGDYQLSAFNPQQSSRLIMVARKL